MVPQSDRPARVAQPDAAQRSQGVVSGRRTVAAGGRQRGADLAPVCAAGVDRLCCRAVPARHHGQHLRCGQPRTDPRHGVSHQGAQSGVQALLRIAHLVQLLRLRDEPHLSSPLHAAPERRPRGSPAALADVPIVLSGADPDPQFHRRPAHRRVDPYHRIHRQDRTQPAVTGCGGARTAPRRMRGWQRCTPATPRSGASRCAGRA